MCIRDRVKLVGRVGEFLGQFPRRLAVADVVVAVTAVSYTHLDVYKRQVLVLLQLVADAQGVVRSRLPVLQLRDVRHGHHDLLPGLSLIHISPGAPP